MKKIYTLIAMMIMAITLNAQVLNVYKGTTLVTSYTQDDADRFVFEQHEYVDLGLSVKWATCNVGADKPEDYGDYFAWGDTEPYYTSQEPLITWKDGKSGGYCWASYKWCNGSETTLTKYCSNSKIGTVDNKTVLDAEDDAAIANWGSNWRMPTEAECEELKANCTWVVTTQNGVKGFKVTSKKSGYTDKSIFLPYAGVYDNTELKNAGKNGMCWSNSSVPETGMSYSIHYYVSSKGSGIYEAELIVGMAGREYGLTVRPVRAK